MNPADKINEMVNKIRVEASDELDIKVHEMIANATTEDKIKQPAAVRSEIWRIVMQSRITKIAAAAVILIAAFIGINMITGDNGEFVAGAEYTGPATCSLVDGSSVELAEGAKIKLYETADKRGFVHLSGDIVVDVEKGKGEFVVATPYGNATALGTTFEMSLIDETIARTNEKIEMLSLKVTEGTVEVSNDFGTVLAEETHEVAMTKDKAPYNPANDDQIPARVRERIAAMKKAFEEGDPVAWAANFNFQAMFDLAKGKIADPASHPWFSQMVPGDVENLKKVLGQAANVEEVREVMVAGINIAGPVAVIVEGAKLSEDGKTVEAVCITGASGNIAKTSPKWTYFDNDWWQTDD